MVYLFCFCFVLWYINKLNIFINFIYFYNLFMVLIFLGCFNIKDFMLKMFDGRFFSMNMKFIMDIKLFFLICFICINMI